MNNKLIEGEDFYFEEVEGIKYKVFTEAYHTKRGFCCNNKCRHCAYKKEDKKKDE